MTAKLRVFVSSVQKELEDERLIVQNLVNTDMFLSAHCVPVLYEFEPASPDKALEGCLKALDICHIYLLIVAIQYGSLVGDLSITHAEYRRAKAKKLPVLAFIRGDRTLKREVGTDALLKELDADGPKYKRFGNVIELQKEVRAALVKLLKDRHGISPSSDENEIALQTIEATSAFESQPLKRIHWTELDHTVARHLVAAADDKNPDKLSDADLLSGASLRGLIWQDSSSGEHYATAAGIVLLAKDPSAVFPQSRIAANAYGGTEKGEPIDRRDIRQPLPRAIQETIDFLIRNMRHTQTVRGFARVEVDEYPYEALREAIINAVAHRDYEIRGASIRIEKYADRISILSPGLPPPPLTLAKLRSLKYLPCSRNPNIARALSYFERIEEQGDGLRRMVTATKDMGLPAPEFSINDGHFSVVFTGPGKSLAKLNSQQARPIFAVEPSVIDTLTANQKTIMRELLKNRQVQVPKLAVRLKVTEQAIRKDMAKLQKMRLIEKRGSARATYYVLNEAVKITPPGGALVITGETPIKS